MLVSVGEDQASRMLQLQNRLRKTSKPSKRYDSFNPQNH